MEEHDIDPIVNAEKNPAVKALLESARVNEEMVFSFLGGSLMQAIAEAKGTDADMDPDMIEEESDSAFVAAQEMLRQDPEVQKYATMLVAFVHDEGNKEGVLQTTLDLIRAYGALEDREMDRVREEVS